MNNNRIHIQFSSFDGPLDLLLSLIEENKMEISSVSLSAVTENFLSYLESIEETNADELADFLVIGTKLILFKSKELLHSLEPDEDDGVPLEDQLKLYKAFVQASKKIHDIWMGNMHSYERIHPPYIPAVIPLPGNVTPRDLYDSIQRLLERIKPPKALPETRIDRSVSLKETIARLRELIHMEKRASFFSFISPGTTKTEIIVHFLALLELVKQKEIDLHQSEVFEDIAIAKI